MIDLSALPPPTVIEEISFEAALAATKADLIARYPAIAPVLALESAVVSKLLEAVAYRELLMRARINDAARANLLAFAAGADLDHLGAFHGVTRQIGEDDTRFVYRIILAQRDRNSGGTEPRYEFLAMTADPRVRLAAVYTEGRDPTVRVAIQSTDNNGVADAPLLAAVTAAVTAPAVRMVNDTILVEAATAVVANVSFKFWLKPEAPISAAAAIEPAVRAAWAVEGALGRDLVASWLAQQMHVPGIARIEDIAPSRSIAAFNKFVSIGTITGTNMGRDF